jgi:hypothetical protein
MTCDEPRADEDALGALAGEIQAPGGLVGLARLLAEAGCDARLHRSPHHAGRRVLRVHGWVDELMVETGDAAACLVSGDDDDVERLAEAARRLSVTLARHALRHRFEVYDADHELAAYFHYGWPLGSP